MLSWTYQATATTEVDLSRPTKTKSEVMQAYNKAYRDRHGGYVQCPCGSVYKEISKYTHPKCARHVKWINSTH